MKILLCILSGQHVPNLLSVHHYKPDRLVLVETHRMKEKAVAEHFLQALAAGGLDYSDKYETVPSESKGDLKIENDLALMHEILQKVYSKYPKESQWIVNVTGGTKPMSIAAFEFFKGEGVEIIYTDQQRPDVILYLDHSQQGNKEERCDYRLPIEVFLAGYGFEIKNRKNKISDAEERAKEWAVCAHEIAKHALPYDILRFHDDEDHGIPADEQREIARKKGCELRGGQLTDLPDELVDMIRETFGLKQGDSSSLVGKIDKYVAEFLTGGWLEVFFWNILAEHKDALDIWDVRLGLVVGQRGKKSENELDVTFMRRHGLAVLECKSGSQEHDKGSEVLYKIDAVVRQFHALNVQSFLATTSRHIYDKESSCESRIKQNIKDRAENYNCRIVTAERIRRIASAEDSTVEVVRNLLFE